MPLLEIEGLRKSFRAPDGEVTPILDIGRFALEEGEQHALRGMSGSGKTTLLHCIAGILAADEGTIRVAGEEVTRLPESRRDLLRARKIGYVFQTFNLLQGYTALENVLLGMMFGRGADPSEAQRLLMRVGLGDRKHHFPRQLSVGQQQRVAVARALANRPALVLADEPTGNLDAHHAAEALGLIRDVCRESGAALLLVTHDREILARFDRVTELPSINRAAS
jgi:putative ABC transport system ATP-binding protein